MEGWIDRQGFRFRDIDIDIDITLNKLLKSPQFPVI